MDIIEPLYKTFDNNGIVLISGDYSLFYIYSKNECREIDSIAIYRKNKNRRGGYSAGRFFRIRLEQVHQYVVKLITMLVNNYIDKTTGLPNIKNLIFAGTGDVPSLLISNPEFPEKLRSITNHVTIPFIDINQALTNDKVKLIVDRTINSTSSIEHKKLNEFLDLVSIGENRITYGIEQVFEYLQLGLIKDLLIIEEIYEQYKKELDEGIKKFGCSLNIINDAEFEKIYRIAGILWYEIGSFINSDD